MARTRTGTTVHDHTTEVRGEDVADVILQTENTEHVDAGLNGQLASDEVKAGDVPDLASEMAAVEFTRTLPTEQAPVTPKKRRNYNTRVSAKDVTIMAIIEEEEPPRRGVGEENPFTEYILKSYEGSKTFGFVVDDPEAAAKLLRVAVSRVGKGKLGIDTEVVELPDGKKKLKFRVRDAIKRPRK